MALVESVKMDTTDGRIQQTCALRGGIVDTNALDRLSMPLGTLQRTHQRSRKPGSGSQFSHPSHALERGDGHDAGQHRDADASEFTAVTKIKKIVVVEKQLGANVVSTGISNMV